MSVVAALVYLGWVAAAPPPGDAARLPPYRRLAADRDFNCRYRAGLERRLEWEPYRRAELRAALAEATELHRVYDEAAAAHPDSPYTQTRGDHLRRLRVLLGPDDYRTMTLPPPVPVWRFNALR